MSVYYAKLICLKNITGDQSYIYIPIVLFTPLFSEKSYANKYIKSQDALTISSNLAQSSSLVEAKRFQIATENLVNMNSTISHYKKNYLTKSCIHQTRRRMARERRGAGSSLVSMETQFYKQYMKDVL